MKKLKVNEDLVKSECIMNIIHFLTKHMCKNYILLTAHSYTLDLDVEYAA